MVVPDARAERARRAAELYLSDDEPSYEECGNALGVSAHTVMRDLKSLGIAARKPDPAPEPRPCQRCGTPFSPTRRQLEQGFGRFCSRECDHEAHRIYPKPDERGCAREGCNNRFVPEAWAVAHGWGNYCSRKCAARAEPRKAAKGQWLTCTQCGGDVWRYDCELERDRGEREGWFCSLECHAEHRRLYPWPGYRRFLSPLASGRARQRVIGAREGRVAGGGDGRPAVGVDAAVAHQVVRLREANPRLGERPIAERFGISRRRVREILAEQAA
jgi:hypothetical protein